MPTLTNAEGVQFLTDYCNKIDATTAEALELQFVIENLIRVIELDERLISHRDIARFRVAQTAASVLLTELATEDAEALKEWQHFDIPTNQSQLLAKILVTSIASFQRAIINGLSEAIAHAG